MVARLSALRPGKIVPTVNAERASERDKLVGTFAKSMDTASSKRTLDSGPAAASGAT